jgi:hypothetical protein
MPKFVPSAFQACRLQWRPRRFSPEINRHGTGEPPSSVASSSVRPVEPVEAFVSEVQRARAAAEREGTEIFTLRINAERNAIVLGFVQWIRRAISRCQKL